MKRTFLTLALAGLSYCFLPEPAMAHWGRWSCGSYSSGYTYYYPRYYYYPNYNSCSSYYGTNYYGNYGSNYGGNVPYPNYGFNSGYSNFGLGGNNLLGLLAGSGLTGANLSGSLLQPSYLSMPVSTGYGPSGFLQIPLGNPAGRATYLQIPVNTGYGPSSYLQIELGRNAGNNTPDAPTPSSTTPNATPRIPPFGAVPGSNASLTSQYTFDTPKTPSDAIPTAVVPTENESAGAIAMSKTDGSSVTLFAESDEASVSNSTDEAPGIQFVSLTRTPAPAMKAVRPDSSQMKDTSFSLVDPNSRDKTADAQAKDASTWEKMALSSAREDLPWQAK